jgi:hypothetical protein
MSQRTDPQKHREQVQAANRARHRATKRLIEKHRDEWDALYAHEAEKEGVTPKPRETVDVASIHAEIAALRTKLDGVVKPKQGRGTRR